MELHYMLHVSKEAHGYRATVLGDSSMEGNGSTREGAIRHATAALRQAVTRGELVSVSVEIPEPNPWLTDGGMWKDMPDEEWEVYQNAIAECRRFPTLRMQDWTPQQQLE